MILAELLDILELQVLGCKMEKEIYPLAFTALF